MYLYPLRRAHQMQSDQLRFWKIRPKVRPKKSKNQTKFIQNVEKSDLIRIKKSKKQSYKGKLTREKRDIFTYKGETGAEGAV